MGMEAEDAADVTDEGWLASIDADEEWVGGWEDVNISDDWKKSWFRFSKSDAKDFVLEREFLVG